MKTILVACLLFVPISLLAGGTYTAEVVVVDIHWVEQNEWGANMVAELYLDGNRQTPVTTVTGGIGSSKEKAISTIYHLTTIGGIFIKTVLLIFFTGSTFRFL